MEAPEFDMKYQKKAGEHISQNIVSKKNEVDSLNILNNNNYQASSPNFWQIISKDILYHT